MLQDVEKSNIWSYFKDSLGRKSYHPKCEGCKRSCKQSFRAVIVYCPIYEKKEE